MESGRTKPDKEAHLGTADIIAQVKLAQAHPMWRWFGAIRLYVFAGVSLVLGLIILASYWRALPHLRRADVRATAEAPSATPRQATGAAAGHGAAQDSAQPPQAPPAQPLPIKVALTRQAGAIWIDGTKVADKKRSWSGHLAPGNHQLAVRVGGHMMRHTFVVEAEALHIALDPVRQSFVVSSSGKGHRTSHPHSY